MKDVIGAVLSRCLAGKRISQTLTTAQALWQSALAGLADQVGEELSELRSSALRRSAMLKPAPKYVELDRFQGPHRRGEILVAAVINVCLEVLSKRLAELRRHPQACS